MIVCLQHNYTISVLKEQRAVAHTHTHIHTFHSHKHLHTNTISTSVRSLPPKTTNTERQTDRQTVVWLTGVYTSHKWSLIFLSENYQPAITQTVNKSQHVSLKCLFVLAASPPAHYGLFWYFYQSLKKLMDVVNVVFIYTESVLDHRESKENPVHYLSHVCKSI